MTTPNDFTRIKNAPTEYVDAISSALNSGILSGYNTEKDHIYMKIDKSKSSNEHWFVHCCISEGVQDLLTLKNCKPSNRIIFQGEIEVIWSRQN